MVIGLLTHLGMRTTHAKSNKKYASVTKKNNSNQSPVQASAIVCFFLRFIILSKFQFITFNAKIGINTTKLKKSCESRAQSSSCFGTPGSTIFRSESTRKWCSIRGVRRIGGAERDRLFRSLLRDSRKGLRSISFLDLRGGVFIDPDVGEPPPLFVPGM